MKCSECIYRECFPNRIYRCVNQDSIRYMTFCDYERECYDGEFAEGIEEIEGDKEWKE